ncbi:MAG: hypothetical protein Q4G14_06605 [Paracoccus sp. (in: a-proteobacteria)]|uniref:hypothetical protein n=1 Tax=Paracoccus sp. TaxID=267 RepID=UPI0026DF61D8|nr:hypothetical protein [Paracoccus sp. (in: a-proteobacteria)]MDO5612900.1 hypothetical protein [Paracoccus sp. (in: a-proteobacteria)]
MNDMTHPNSAARISDDIGDVLSAIRRLIAEDEAFADGAAPDADAAPVGDGDLLAHRYGGNAALARRFAAPHRLEDAVADSPAGAAHALHPFEVEVMSDSPAPAPAPALAAAEDAPDSAPLRLSAADRIPPQAEAGKDTPPAAPRRSRWSRIGLPVNRRAAARTLAQPVAETPAPEAVQPAQAQFLEPLSVETTAAVDVLALDAAAIQSSAAAEATPAMADPDPVIVEGDEAEQPLPAVAGPASSDLDLALGNDADDAGQALREMIRDIVQQELHGELGQRFSRNLRAVIRREVLAAIEDNFDRS